MVGIDVGHIDQIVNSQMLDGVTYLADLAAEVHGDHVEELSAPLNICCAFSTDQFIDELLAIVNDLSVLLGPFSDI